ncbi:hypothetical protein Cni_G09777 [Canna indica]|uniref:Uncharacterized protein n=1 Tax=Canna indica TaxID=4628 RepID=A0AAQ3Q806_9LILI|nr:hypothetical protein Cni_G09777 [Canna indica]
MPISNSQKVKKSEPASEEGTTSRMEIEFKASEVVEENKEEKEKEKTKKVSSLEELSMKLSNSFSKILENEFAKEDFLEEGLDPELSRNLEGRPIKARKGMCICKNLINIPISYKQLKPKKKRISLDKNKEMEEVDQHKLSMEEGIDRGPGQ